MGYYTRQGMVEERKDLLEKILTAVSEGRTLEYPCLHILHLPKQAYQINNLLRACTLLPEECGGRYATLRSLVEVSQDIATSSILIRPKQGGIPFAIAMIKATDPSERDVLRVLSTDRDRPVIVHAFTPSSEYTGDEWLEKEGDRLGYEIIIVGNDPPFQCIAKRRPKRSAFDIIKR
jgi:hypothetical protein